jgi:hypothetical protein
MGMVGGDEGEEMGEAEGEGVGAEVSIDFKRM